LTSQPPAIGIEHLATRYGATQVLSEITLDVLAGETLGLIGLNGAGKTTLLKSVLMLVRPCAGSVRLFGADHADPASRAQLAYLPERFQPPGDLAGHDFVRLTLAFHRRRVSRASAALSPRTSISTRWRCRGRSAATPRAWCRSSACSRRCSPSGRC
jgi:ABC-type multidrug transport system ATPase subunit